MNRNPASSPGISRHNRISDEGLLRLENQLNNGQISHQVLEQWIKRYGDKAIEIIEYYKEKNGAI
ncbi:MAG: hypothetical protein QM479_09555 [Pseudomonadota bacterium]